MSLVNQVLNELERRGASSPLDGEAIRAIQPRKQSNLPRYALFAAALLIVMAVLVIAFKYQWRAEKSVPEQAVVVMPPMVASASAPVDAVMAMAGSAPADVQPLESLHGKPLIAMESEEKPVDVPAPEVKKTKHHEKQKKDELGGQLAENGSTGGVAEQEPGKSKRHKKRKKTEQDESSAESGFTDDATGLPLKKVSLQQRIDNEFGKANRAAQEGKLEDARTGYERVLHLSPTHLAARQALAGVLVRLKRSSQAEVVVQDGLKLDPHQVMLSMLLARLQVERGDVAQALETLQTSLPNAGGRADYRAFMAALLQRQKRHEEAIEHFQAALKQVPNNGVWLMGMGISMQALGRIEDARTTYQNALASNSLNPQLQAYVQQKLKEL